MFTLDDHLKLNKASWLLKDNGLLPNGPKHQGVSPNALVCYLTMLASDEKSFSVQSLSGLLNWSLKRTRRYLGELASTPQKGRRLVDVVKSSCQSAGRFASVRYQLVFAQTKEGTESFSRSQSPLLAKAKVAKPPPNLPLAIHPATGKASVDSHYPQKTTGKEHEEKPFSTVCLLNKKKQQTKTEAPTNVVNPEAAPCSKNGNGSKENSSPKKFLSQKLTEKLISVGISSPTIQQLLANYPEERILRQLDYLPYRKAQNPPGLLVNSIKQDWSGPQAYLDMKAQSLPRSIGEEKDALAIKHSQKLSARKEAKEVKQKQLKQKLLAFETQLSSADKHALLKEAERRIRQRLGLSWTDEKPIPETFLKAEFYRVLNEKA